jgi:hypothetical protein
MLNKYKSIRPQKVQPTLLAKEWILVDGCLEPIFSSWKNTGVSWCWMSGQIVLVEHWLLDVMAMANINYLDLLYNKVT